MSLPYSIAERIVINLIRNKVIIGVAFFAAHLQLFFSLYYVFVMKNFAVDAFLYALYPIVNAWPLDYLLWKRKIILQQWEKFSVYTDDLRRFPKQLLRRCVFYNLANFFIILITLVTSLVQATLQTNTNSIDYNWYSTYCFGCNITQLSDSTVQFLKCFDEILYNVGTTWELRLLPTAFCCFFILVSNLVHEVNVDLKRFARLTSTSKLCAESVVNWRSRYQKIQDMVKETDAILHGFNLYCYLISFSTFCHGATLVIKFAGKLETMQLVSYALLHFLPLVYTAFLSFSASMIPDEFVKGVQQVHQLSLSYGDVETAAYNELQLLIVQLTTQQNGMTIGGFFVLTKVSFLSFLGAVVSYVIILLQLFPELLTKLKGQE